MDEDKGASKGGVEEGKEEWIKGGRNGCVDGQTDE